MQGRDIATIVEVICLICIAVCAFCGNLLVFLSVYRDKKLRTKGGVFICCLSSADFLVSIYNIPLTIASTFDSSLRANKTCEIMAYFEMLLLVVSVQSLTAISINRYFFIIHWHKYHEYFRRRNTVLFVITVWVVSALLCLPPLVGWSKFGYKETKGHCFVLWKADPYYTYLMALACFCGPIISMSISYYRIIRYTRNTRRDVQRMTNSPANDRKNTIWHCDSSYSSTSDFHRVDTSKKLSVGDSKCNIIDRNDDVLLHKFTPKPNGYDTVETTSIASELSHGTSTVDSVVVTKVKKNKKSPSKRGRIADEQRLTRMFIVVVVVFFASWFPFVITMFTEFYTNLEIPPFLDKLTLLFGYANSMYNPIIYGFMNGRYRRAYRLLLGDLKAKLSCSRGK